MLNIGDTFLLATPPNDMHLFIVIASFQHGNYLCVNITTLRHNSDTSCILQSGDHPFIKHDSVINYKGAQELNPLEIPNLTKNGKFYKRTAISSTILKKIQYGGINSKRLKKKFKKVLKEAV